MKRMTYSRQTRIQMGRTFPEKSRSIILFFKSRLNSAYVSMVMVPWHAYLGIERLTLEQLANSCTVYIYVFFWPGVTPVF